MNQQQYRAAQQRFAAFDPNFRLHQGIVAGSLGAVGAVSLADLMLGNTNAFNSGEIPLNALYQLAPLLAMSAGGTIGAMTYDEAAAVKRANDLYAQEVKAAKEGLRGRTYKDADERVKAQSEFADRRNKAAEYRDRTTAEVPGMRGLTGGQFRRAQRGAAIGSAIGSVPAILGMLDSGEV